MWRPPSGPQEEESLRNSIRVLRKRKYVVLWWMLGFVAGSVLICLLMKPQYTASATLLVDKQSSGGVDLQGLSGLASAVGGEDQLKDDLQTHATLLRSDSTALQVVKTLNLTKYPPYAVRPGISLWLNPALKAESERPLDNAPAMRERLLKVIDKRLSVKPMEGTRLITVSYRDSDPERAAAIANAFVDIYIHEYLEMKFRATAEASDWLTGQLNSLKARAEASQQALANYEQQTGLGALMLGNYSDAGRMSDGAAVGGGGVVRLPAVDRLAALNQEVTAAEADRISKEAIYRLTLTQSPDVVLGLNSSSLAAGVSSSVLSAGGGLSALEGLRVQQAALQAQYSDYLTKYGARNPHLLELQGRMAALDTAIQAEMARIKQRAENDFTLAKKSEDAIKQSYVQQEAVVNKLNDSTVRLGLLESDAGSSRALYNELSSRLQEANIAAGVQATNLSNVDKAEPPASPSRPLWTQYPLVALIAGLVFGIGAAFVRENLDDTILTPDHAEEASWFPLLSTIPLLEEPKGAKKLPVSHAARNGGPLEPREEFHTAEAFRSLRTAIRLSTVDAPLRTLLVTSPMVGDGKTTVTYNMAVAFAQTGARVLLIDADMRRPRLHILAGTARSPGLAEVLTGSNEWSEVLKSHATYETLVTLPAGTSPPNPAELLGSKQMDTLLQETLKEFEMVIVDSPPMLVVSDSVMLSTKVDGTILVIRSGRTTKMALRRASEILLPSPGRKLGVVMNAVDTRSSEYYYSYGYYGDSKYYEEV